MNLLKDRSGALLISLVATMTVLAALGATLVYMTSISVEQELVTNVHNRAYYLAESGFRYAVSQRGPSLAENPSLFTNSIFSMGSNDRFELTTYENPLNSNRVIVQSDGIVNQGIEPNGATRRIVYDVLKDNLAGEEIIGEEISEGNDSAANDDFEDLSGWHENPNFSIEPFESGTGTHLNYAVSDKPQTEDPGEHVRISNLVLNNNAEFATQWSDNHHMLSYDVQVKMSWGYQLEYGAQGISFRLHESETVGKYEFYAISFMRYLSKDTSTGSKDFIPDDIKPVNAGGGTLADRALIVLWQQKVAAGQEVRQWIAYKDLGSTGDKYRYIRGNQWEFDGQCMGDNSTLLVRVHEKKVSGAKVQDVKIFFADASPIYTSRTPNAAAYDILNSRNYYWPSYEEASPHPAYPPVTISNWTVSDDYFSFIANSPDTYTYYPTNWDRTAPDVSVLPDGGTLRLPQFTTPDGVSPGQTTFPADREEIGLHVIGQLTSGNHSMAFDDFALRYLNTDGSSDNGYIQR